MVCHFVLDAGGGVLVDRALGEFEDLLRGHAVELTGHAEGSLRIVEKPVPLARQGYKIHQTIVGGLSVEVMHLPAFGDRSSPCCPYGTMNYDTKPNLPCSELLITLFPVSIILNFTILIINIKRFFIPQYTSSIEQVTRAVICHVQVARPAFRGAEADLCAVHEKERFAEPVKAKGLGVWDRFSVSRHSSRGFVRRRYRRG